MTLLRELSPILAMAAVTTAALGVCAKHYRDLRTAARFAGITALINVPLVAAGAVLRDWLPMTSAAAAGIVCLVIWLRRPR